MKFHYDITAKCFYKIKCQSGIESFGHKKILLKHSKSIVSSQFAILYLPYLVFDAVSYRV